MSKINVLESNVYNKISAGEVVERPASVVKELVENSIDAGATSITISIENGGISLIRVVDNGNGIEKEDIKKAFMPHATSKIKDADDLFKISTLGFRGEALASICSVSQVSVVSKTKDTESGNCLEIDGGNQTKECEIGAPNGTNMSVSNLFYNVPVRYKFLKKPKQEEQEITNLISRIILANPNLSIKYIADGKEVFSNNGRGLKEAIFNVYGKETSMNTLEVNYSTFEYKITGYVGKPSYSKPNRTYQTIIINGRHIENSMISLAVANAYGETLMKRQYPFFVLNLQIPIDQVDVNVHPSKKEVRFENSNKIFGSIYTAVLKALQSERDIKNIETNEMIIQKNIEIKQKIVEPILNTTTIENATISQNKEKNDEMLLNFTKFNNILQKNINTKTQTSDVFSIKNLEPDLSSKLLEDEQIERKNAKTESKNINEIEKIDVVFADKDTQKNNILEHPNIKNMNSLFEEDVQIKIVGVIFNTYILVQKNNELLLIDQHAGHEKILYDKFMEQIKNKTLEIQQLLLPEILKVNTLEKNYIEDCLVELNSLGFEICEFGDNCYKLSSIPLILVGMNIADFWSYVLADLKDYSKKDITKLIKDRIASNACKSAVKGGNVLSELEIRTLLSELSSEKIALHCPHGRPIVVRLAQSEIEKWFKRIV